MIKNIAKNKIIIKNYKIADNIFTRGLGLMFSRKADFNYGLIFDLERETRVGASIHMYFVFFPINIVFLDSKKTIVDIKFGLKPFKTVTPKSKCRYVIELPMKYGKNLYSIGNKLSW